MTDSSMIDPSAVEAAIADVRALVEADGGELLVSGTGADSVALKLVLESAECAECVMPKQFLETVALDMMGPKLSALRSVLIDDPREATAT